MSSLPRLAALNRAALAAVSAHAAVFAALALTCAPAAQAQSLLNASFEAPAIADGTLSATTATGWAGGQFVMNPDAAGQFAGNPTLWPQADSGQQYLDIGNTAASPLTQSLLVAQAGSYAFGWSDNTALFLPAAFHTSPYRAEVLDGAAQVMAGATFDAWHADGLWQPRTLLTTLMAGTYTLRLTSQNVAFSADTLIDSASISAVPESGTAALLALGLGLLASARRRR
jgi:hypothetical protein